MRNLPAYAAVFLLGVAVCLLVRGNGAPVLWRGGRAVAGLPSVADAAARIQPAVVNIDVTGGDAAGVGTGAGRVTRGLDPWFEGAGSGIIVRPDGYVVTNNHVIEPAARGGRITVRLDNGREYRGVRVVGRDPQTDLAVLKIDGASRLPAAELGDSDDVRVGDWAIAVGNPLGFNSSVTLGIVSALNRRNFRNHDADALDRVIQTDAPINPGSSGGALADTCGRVIGINTAIASSTGASVGIGFAIPVNAARRVIEELIKTGKVTRPYLGVVYTPLDSVEPRALPSGVRLPSDYGAVVYSDDRGAPAVVPDSPAARAGLKPFDVIREVDGHKIGDVRDVKRHIQARRVGEKAQVTVWRSGREFTLAVPLDRMPDDYGRLTRPNRPAPGTPFAVPDHMPELTP